ncbi:hypothetical protein EJ04DRAFT_573709 [Polyplosphaeria fusca]|uniref:DUF7932 domain-containing protein n=1 Tax=Polyplosphaeria fusca TaxID=682080 RepID=A0A9P4R825_9PLEO|nr:hypothetical protein EJ04DRAFT_573709 [Polyplosphaeria fusca]
MEARETKLIDTSGRDGMPAPEFLGSWHGVAPVGYRGNNGNSAATPTAGTPGSDIRVRVAYASEEAGVVQVVGEGVHTGQAWKVERDENLLLKANGGRGGDGGRGEDGQPGGRGRDGRAATKHRSGEDGGDGAQGGNGGYGSNGADGACGGHVFVTVHDEDTDLLVPLQYNVSGGPGGVSGEHGEPGDGGTGGRGGAPFAWTEKHSNYVSAHTNPGGVNGRNGGPGSRPSTFLTGGRSGANGSVQIKVIRGDLSEATYPGVYSLQVTKFDIIDEGEDGINEPGEYLHVHNIRVRNVGGMPSPEARSIQVLIERAQFLEPVITEPVELPRSIQPGQEVEVPGVLRAFIRNEWQEKPLGLCLKAREFVRLVAFFNERLNRPLPNFCAQTAIWIEYPLVLDPPTYLDCVAKGDKVRFRWVLHNNSTKPYGIDSLLKRATATKLCDPNRFFNLAYATADNPGEATDDIPEIEPHSKVTIDQDFYVDENTLEYSEGNLSLELTLADPKTGAMRSIQKHAMHMQISGKYQLSPNPSFLLVINSKTPNYAIHQIIVLVRQRLHTSLDIFNLNLVGSYESPVTKENVLKSYEGKSIIMFGNRFTFFDRGEINPWDILDPWNTGLLMKGGTSLLYVSVGDLAGLNTWTEKLTFPTTHFATGAQSVNASDTKGLVADLKKTDAKLLTSAMDVHRVPVQKSMFKGLPSSVDSATKTTAKRLNKNMPLRRFIALPDLEAAAPDGTRGGIIICEGVPKNSNLVASVDPFSVGQMNALTIADHYLFLIVSCIPFATRARIFWNIVGQAIGNGLPTGVTYSGLGDFAKVLSSQSAVVDKKILDAVAMSLQYNISTEIYRFTTSRPRFPDPLDPAGQLQQLSLVTQFFAAAPKSAVVVESGNAQLLVSTLGAIHAISNPLNFWQGLKGSFAFCGNRKGKLTPGLNSWIFTSISSACNPAVAGSIKDHVLQRSKQVKAGIRAAGGKKSFAAFGREELAAFAGTRFNFVDMTEIKDGSLALAAAVVDGNMKLRASEKQYADGLERDAKKMLVDMVNPVDES